MIRASRTIGHTISTWPGIWSLNGDQQPQIHRGNSALRTSRYTFNIGQNIQISGTAVCGLSLWPAFEVAHKLLPPTQVSCIRCYRCYRDGLSTVLSSKHYPSHLAFLRMCGCASLQNRGGFEKSRTVPDYFSAAQNQNGLLLLSSIALVFLMFNRLWYLNIAWSSID